MYIHNFTAKNFLIHKETSLALSPVTVLVGPNGGGKSALFDAIVNFSMLARGDVGESFGPFPFSFAGTRFHAALPTAPIGFEAVLARTRTDEERLSYSISYRQAGPAEAGKPGFQISHESLKSLKDGKILFEGHNPEGSPLKNAIEFWKPDRGIFAAVRAANFHGKQEDNPLVSHCAREISKVTKYRLSAYRLAAPSLIPDLDGSSAPPRIHYEGENLAACLYFMHKTNDPALNSIRDRIKILLPEFSDFEFTTFGVDKVAFSMTFSDGRGAVTAVRMSHGNLLFLGLVVLMNNANRPALIMIEEPENGLTPVALKSFYDMVRKIAYAENDNEPSQVFISSHSPFVICDVWNEHEPDREFIHLAKVEGGQAVVRRFKQAIADLGLPLGKDEQGARSVLGLRLAEQIMSGYYDQSSSAASA